MKLEELIKIHFNKIKAEIPDAENKSKWSYQFDFIPDDVFDFNDIDYYDKMKLLIQYPFVIEEYPSGFFRVIIKNHSYTK